MDKLPIKMFIDYSIQCISLFNIISDYNQNRKYLELNLEK